ncbi:ImmA/IrrE family metallo-endopeptidase [Streptomyces boncukensis]|uniref:ImmA/IrrE family metallo-endopeptidase n=1 Tax=Streptomyces boncukensis TaxID=2711219 RepID=A0A6G4WX15_9ACTN|nr:ImmA/IrrE family metallo-endopeptidase [Streptomyces boncukensis]NGO69170.1 ImmA/IrrE family metallo-endopeptidase [Streptomyces boncukensis]
MSVVGSFLIEPGRSYSPHQTLETLGVIVVRTWLRDTWGAWSYTRRKIVIASGLSLVQERCVLAHEVEHVIAAHDGCGDGQLAVRQERLADLEAARKLVAISDLCEVAQWADDIRLAAHELQVTERMLRIRLRDLEGEGWPWLAGSTIAG